MVKCFLLITILMSISYPSLSEMLLNNKKYTVPENEQWEVADYNRLKCHVCTADIYVKSGSVKINRTWINGVFNFSLNQKEPDVVIDANTEFSLGDVLKSLTIKKENIEK